MRKSASESGLNDRLPGNHPLLILFRATLSISHGEGNHAADNYVANVARVLHFVHKYLLENGAPPKHWSDLLTTSVKPYKQYLSL